MIFSHRNYEYGENFGGDYRAVRNFLVAVNEPALREYDFEWGRWEWAHCLQNFNKERSADIGLWTRGGRIVAASLFEIGPGPVYPVIDPVFENDPDLLDLIFEHAQTRLTDDRGEVKILIKNRLRGMQKAGRVRGFVPNSEYEENSILDMEATAPAYRLEEGFRIRSLSEGFDILQYNRVLWKGFEHDGPAPEDPASLEQRRRQISSPNCDPDLKIAVESPEGEYVAYCGSWYDRSNNYLLIEPVATVPEYRRRGFAAAAVLEAAIRGREKGATCAIVGSAQQFYYSIGFDPLPQATFWSWKAPSPRRISANP